ncbi:MAG: DUF4295 domain-containing protein [Bacteroidales bacterium]|nr:DUF4295 domain-containing protein [Bacteroidales bacterium]
MAKKVVATLQAKGKSVAKVIKMVKSPKSDAYLFKEDIIPVDQVDGFFKK